MVRDRETLRSYDKWKAAMIEDIAEDKLWSIEVYRKALFSFNLVWHYLRRVRSNNESRAIADQLFRAVGSISANIAEGYSKSTGRDRRRFFEYALGSSREARDWYYKCGFVLGEKVTLHRIGWQTDIIKQLLSMIPTQRNLILKESPTLYRVEATEIPFCEDEDSDSP